MGILRGIVGLILALILVTFAVANRQTIDIVWSPFHPQAQIPVYVLTLGFLAIGFVLGGFVVWLNSLPVHWQKRKQSKQIKNLEKELGSIKDKSETGLLQPLPDPDQKALTEWT